MIRMWLYRFSQIYNPKNKVRCTVLHIDIQKSTNAIQWFILPWKRSLLQASTLLPKLLPFLCVECIRWSVNGLWAVHGFACLRRRLVKVCCVSVVFKVALVRSVVRLKCDSGMQDVPFFFPLSRYNIPIYFSTIWLLLFIFRLVYTTKVI